jgi:monoamine oxidase
VWDGNEEQPGRPGILTLLAGGRASEATRHLLSHLGPEGIVRELTWLDFKKTKILASTSVSWEHEPWSRGGYAYFDTAFSPTSRAWLSRPFRRVFFAGEHTSIRWQGYMNGAVESGLRAAEEVALASGREDPHF